MKKIICFDVDGVLINSEEEILLTSWNEYNAWLTELGLPAQPFTTSPDDVPDSFRKIRTELGKKSHKGYYRVAINLFALAGFDPAGIDQELIQRVSEADPALKAKTMARLKVVRDRLHKEGDLKQLIRCFDVVDYGWIKERMDAGELFFVTNNSFSIEGLKAVALMPDERYVRRPHGDMHDKANHLNEICKTCGVPPEKVLFIDDSEASLLDVASGAALPRQNIVQNQWCAKPAAKGFDCVGWDELMERFDKL